jgi:hypothetical protein
LNEALSVSIKGISTELFSYHAQKWADVATRISQSTGYARNYQQTGITAGRVVSLTNKNYWKEKYNLILLRLAYN